MTRSTCSVARHKRRKRLFKKAKGYWGDRKNHIRQTKNAVMKAMKFSYFHRKRKKRDFRALWIARLSAAAKINGMCYSHLIAGLKKLGSLLNRKVLSEMAIHHPEHFALVVEEAKGALKS